jgi:hypothetical protein
MSLQWLKPTKYKLIIFVIIYLLLFFLPVVPVLSAPVVLNPINTWGLQSPAYSLQNVNLVGVNNQYFGVVTGAEGALLNSLYVFLVAYLIACVFAYFYHRPAKQSTERHAVETQEHQ